MESYTYKVSGELFGSHTCDCEYCPGHEEEFGVVEIIINLDHEPKNNVEAEEEALERLYWIGEYEYCDDLWFDSSTLSVKRES